MPITPFMGVRISWLMLARNWLLARLASSSAAVPLRHPLLEVAAQGRSSSRWTREKRLASETAMEKRKAAKPKGISGGVTDPAALQGDVVDVAGDQRHQAQRDGAALGMAAPGRAHDFA